MLMEIMYHYGTVRQGKVSQWDKGK